MPQYAVAFNTTGSEAEAQALAQALVNRGAAACVTIIPKVKSYYKWKDELCTDTEWLLLIKTSMEQQTAIEGILKELHSYEVPELIFLSIQSGNSEYLSWLASNLH